MNKAKTTIGNKVPNAAKVKQSQTTSSTAKSTTVEPTATSPKSAFQIEELVLIWLDKNVNVQDANYRHTAKHLQSIANTVHVFNDTKLCIKFFGEVKNQRVFMIISGSAAQETLPQTQSIRNLKGVFIFCQNKSKYEPLREHWQIIRGVFTDILLLCESLRKEARQWDDDSICIKLLSNAELSSKNLDQLDPSFMYTQLLKEILLELDYNDESLNDLVNYCLKKFSSNSDQLQNVNKFHNEYNKKLTIRWYTADTFVYRMLNRCLREQDIDLIVLMGFFISDLDHNIEQLHKKQIELFSKTFTVYRGQRMPVENFEQLKRSQGGLISFNSFLSTSKTQDISLDFATKASNDQESVGILFVITVDPSISSALFASIKDFSAFEYEEEILFSMLTIFRIGDIKLSDTDKKIWLVALTLTSDSDKQLNTLIDQMRKEIEGPSALYRLGSLMIKLDEFDGAEKVFRKLLDEQTTDELYKGNIYFQLGQINDNQKKAEKALENYYSALAIYQKHLPEDHSNIATCYNNIGLAYDNKNELAEALEFYEKALNIYRKTLEVDHTNIAASCCSIGLLYNTKGDYQNALKYCKTALEIFVKKLPSNHPSLALSYNNLGLVYANMKRYSEAIASYKQAIEIGQLVLPPHSPTLKIYKNNLEAVMHNAKK